MLEMIKIQATTPIIIAKDQKITDFIDQLQKQSTDLLVLINQEKISFYSSPYELPKTLKLDEKNLDSKYYHCYDEENNKYIFCDKKVNKWIKINNQNKKEKKIRPIIRFLQDKKPEQKIIQVKIDDKEFNLVFPIGQNIIRKYQQ
jgi:hypothetical protein